MSHAYLYTFRSSDRPTDLARWNGTRYELVAVLPPKGAYDRPCLCALRRSIATRARYGLRWSRVRIIDEAAASADPARVARAQRLGWTPAGYVLYAMRCAIATRVGHSGD